MDPNCMDRIVPKRQTNSMKAQIMIAMWRA